VLASTPSAPAPTGAPRGVPPLDPSTVTGVTPHLTVAGHRSTLLAYRAVG
jgi:hypothetical protein